MQPIEIGDITLEAKGELMHVSLDDCSVSWATSSTWSVAGAQLAAGVLLHWIAAMTGEPVLVAAATALRYAEQQRLPREDDHGA